MTDDERQMPEGEDDNRGVTEDHGGNAAPATDPTRTVPETADEDADERPN